MDIIEALRVAKEEGYPVGNNDLNDIEYRYNPTTKKFEFRPSESLEGMVWRDEWKNYRNI